ncbi:MAG: hypothetical protein AAF591_15870 [Verrucomicrobiota bacterium]
MKIVQRIRLWVSAEYRWVAVLPGLVIGLIVMGVGAQGLIKETATLVEELGTGGYLVDALMRIAFCIGLAAWSAGPYLLVAILQGRTRWPRVLAGFGVIVFALNLYLFYEVFVMSTSSTAALGLIFFPFYLGAFVLVFWFVMLIAAKVMREGKSSNGPPPLRGA